jgi:hypothetical protein
VDAAQDDSWRGCFTAWHYLAGKLSHAGVDVDVLACRIHHPTAHSCQTRSQSLLAGAILSCRSNGWWCISGGCEAPRALTFRGELIALVLALPNLTWSKLFLPWDAYPMTDSSWRFRMYSWSSGYIRR